MTNLPNWVFDIVQGLADQADGHPRLLFESGAFQGTRQYEWCPCQTLAKVPPEVVAQARVLNAYLRSAGIETAEARPAAESDHDNRPDPGA